MASRLDHLTVVAPSLEAGARLVREALGVEPGPGRTHPDMGTHNLLLRLGDTVYLEVIAADPSVASVPRPRWFGLDGLSPDSPPRLATWVAGTDDIAADAVETLGVVETMRRASHTWQMTLTADGHLPLAGAAPALIQRTPGPHPASVLPDHGCRLRRLRLRHPEPARLVTLLADIRLAARPEVVVEHGETCSLAAEIDTPAGPRLLGSSQRGDAGIMTRKVLASFDSPDGSHCLDVFVRDDGSFGFEEFRGESDGGARWQSLGRHGALRFASGAAALSAAQKRVPWLDPSESWRW